MFVCPSRDVAPSMRFLVLVYEASGNRSVGILLEISAVMFGFFVWSLYDYRRAPRKLSAETRKKLQPVAKAWDVTPEELQNTVVPRVLMYLTAFIGSACTIVWLFYARNQ